MQKWTFVPKHWTNDSGFAIRTQKKNLKSKIK